MEAVVAREPYLKLTDLRGGINDGDSPFSLAANQVVEAVNIDYRAGMIGTKRGGCAPVALTSSVFVRDVPLMAQRNTGGFTGAASGSISVSANGASAASHILIVFIVNTGGTVTGVTLGGVALTQISTVLNTHRLDAWYLRNPSIAGGSLVVNLSGAGDCAIIAERWTNVDTASSPVAGSTTSGTSTAPSLSSASYNPTHMALSGVGHGAATLTADTIGSHTSGSQTSGNARVASIAKIGMKATTLFRSSLSGSVVWTENIFALLGASLTTGRPIKALIRHQPTNILSGDELWAQDDYGRLDRRVAGTWQTGVPVQNYQVGSFLTGGASTNGASAHGKLFLALEGTTYADRTHIWDGTILRWSGFSTPSPVTAADSGGIGTLSGTRYYRMRYTQQVSGVTVRRSEPSTVLTFTPGGANTSITITKPADGGFVSGEGETHWELEASVDNTNFYVLATTVIGTTTVVDSESYNDGYTSYELSEALTEYIPLPAARHVVIDEDRVLIGGSPYTAINDSRISWTPVRADLGAGNDERVPATARFFLDLDGLSGGRLTQLMPAVMGGIMAFKMERVYKLIRTGRSSKAYDSIQLTANRGALPRSCSNGTDENGQPCIYFVDPNVGAVRWGQRGQEDLMQLRRTLSARINQSATVIARTIFYPKHWLVWVFLALDSSSVPNYIACFNVRQRSWTDYTGNMATAVAIDRKSVV